MEYIFPVAEIEYHIFDYLDPPTDFKSLSLVSSYYNDFVSNHKTYSALKIFLLTIH